MKAYEQEFLRAVLRAIVEHEGMAIERIAAELRAQGENFTDEDLQLACDLLREAGYTERRGVR